MQPRRKYRTPRRRAQPGALPTALLKFAAGLLVTGLLSIFFIFCHDAITQCRYFTLREITVSGADRIGTDRVLRQAELQPGINILGVNLTAARKRLLAHPWISEAAIRRIIPSGMRISIVEHRPLAIIDVGRRFLVDTNGEIFKKLDPGDPQDLPMIGGLCYGDLDLEMGRRPAALRLSEAIAAGRFDIGSLQGAGYRSAVAVLQLGRQKSAVLPNAVVRLIQVDREIGITIYTRNQERVIRLGFNDYARKLDVLRSILAFSRQPKSWRWGDIESIDLNNPDRVVVHLFREKEV